MKKSHKKANYDPLRKQSEKNDEQGKDYAHYPPAATEQVKPPAHKNHAADKGDKADNPPSTSNTVVAENDAEKELNGSRKIVNSIDESYSDGSGGGFEATEQVND